ncbi:LytTR family DNA-binding domain-containing protein [Flavobacteriaceae bacterium S0825]|uniref:LytR/AlgR family response regulator transcription factor n=1 Tax=Gaetbulibacter sp. S0825 TaxID=2720084 RepID=UPI00142FF186|nr:LytTR family DNA-binding domain-containing protein [Gaetbulibacter sp. S0825]MCK0109749.1 LytTR family DNA-binding domain-containing protein [Flavobacteriaceae bacterium S0825]NIX65381.1 response regulator transcription factor [Gaetbulibacter sp. S0825]
MQKYKTILVDDEPLAIDVLIHYLKSFPEFEIVKTFTNSVEAFKFLHTEKIDLVFTDIAMPQISGTELVKLAQDKTQFVMVTSFSEYAIESFELNVIDYLLKPVSFERFSKTIERFKSSVTTSSLSTKQDENATFFIKEGDEFIKVVVEDIDYIEGMKDYAKIVCGKNYYLALKTLKSIEEKLSSFGFIRIHKSFVIPINKVIQYNSKSVLVNTHQIPVGNSYRNSLKKYLEENKL